MKTLGKKILTVMLALCLTFAFAACEGDSNGNGGGNGAGETKDNIIKADDFTWRNKAGKDVYDDEFLDMYFFSDKNDAVTYFCNSMYKSYGDLTMGNQPYVGLGVGWCPAWYEWMALIRNWSDNDWVKNRWRNYLIDCPISADGYVWSYDTPHWPDLGFTDSHHNFHYDNNFRFVITVWNFCAWENSLDLLNAVDPSTVANDTEAHEGTYHQAEDVSKGKTVGWKLEKAIDYVMNELHGKDGLIIIDENAQDGLNLGTNDSYSCNYWDNIPFGYKDAYENILFYNMLKSLIELETMRENAEQATYYRDLAATVKTNYNKTFWNEKTGRYVGTVDVNGIMRDYGITFVNTEAVAAGLSSAEQAKSIYDWLDGKRIVAGDTSTGEDIYRYIAAPRSNTLDYGAISDPDAENKFWWHDNNGGQALSGNGAYGYHVENGGAILYTEYYDIMGRIASGDLTSAYARMETLAREYAKDELNRDPMNPTSGGYDVLGFVGEFPESGLVPVAYLYGFIGVNLRADGIYIAPNIPEGYGYMGVNDIVFDGKIYTMCAYRDGKFRISSEEGMDIALSVKDTAGVGTRKLVLFDRYDNAVSSALVTAKDGEFRLDLTDAGSIAYACLQ
jgi:hypothetical protein